MGVNMKTSLIIMAAGIGSRFGGGIKQLAKVGPSGEVIVDYSIHDALKAGFDDVVFIIRRDIEKDFREIIGDRIEKICPCTYVFQDINDLPGGLVTPEGRTKPWGTGHAVLACKGVVKNPACIINADDYYGKEAFKLMHDYIVNSMNTGNSECMDIAMPGFILKNTLSDNGSVTRGVCSVNSEGKLTSIEETKNIYKSESGAYKLEGDKRTELDPECAVSMNMWAVTPKFIDGLEERFEKFLRDGNISDAKAEFLLPTIIGDMIKNKTASVQVINTSDRWFGVTYAEDKATVMDELQKLSDSGAYPNPLFADI